MSWKLFPPLEGSHWRDPGSARGGSVAEPGVRAMAPAGRLGPSQDLRQNLEMFWVVQTGSGDAGWGRVRCPWLGFLRPGVLLTIL